MLFVTTCCSELNINVIPQVLDNPEGQKDTFFGASLALKDQTLYLGAPYQNPKSKQGVFKCHLEKKNSNRNTCARDKSFSDRGR